MPNPKPAHPVVSIQYWLVTDRRTGGQTDTPTLYDSICRTSIASRGKKIKVEGRFLQGGVKTGGRRTRPITLPFSLTRWKIVS